MKVNTRHGAIGGLGGLWPPHFFANSNFFFWRCFCFWCFITDMMFIGTSIITQKSLFYGVSGLQKTELYPCRPTIIGDQFLGSFSPLDFISWRLPWIHITHRFFVNRMFLRVIWEKINPRCVMKMLKSTRAERGWFRHFITRLTQVFINRRHLSNVSIADFQQVNVR